MMDRTLWVKIVLTVALVTAGAVVSRAAERTVVPPPNGPADVRWDADKRMLRLSYHGTVVLDAVVTARGRDGKETPAGIAMQPEVTGEEKVEQRLTFTLAEPREDVELLLRGTVTGSEEAFPAETRFKAQERFPCVRNSVGLSRNLRSNAVYDRRWDWVLTGPGDGATRIQPKKVGTREIAFAWESQAEAIELVFRPRFYQRHKGLKYYQPWTYRVWEGSVSGYCSWWAYRGGFNQETLDQVVEVCCRRSDSPTSGTATCRLTTVSSRATAVRKAG